MEFFLLSLVFCKICLIIIPMESWKGDRRKFIIDAAIFTAGFLLWGCARETESTTLLPTTQPESIIPLTEALSLAEQERLARHRRFHYPIIEGKETPATPYLTLPFRESDLRGEYDITEGWIYSQEEQAIHGLVNHNAVDIFVPYGIPVVAPTDGYAISSYHTFWLRDESGRTKSYQGKSLRFGLGYFVQIYVPSVNRFIQMAHLSDIDPSIPFSVPIPNGEDWNPTNHNLKIADLKTNSKVVEVNKGNIVGRVGFSGLAWGYKDYISGEQRPVQIDPAIQKSWDEPHIHFEDFWRDQSTGQKIANRDPYGIYSIREDYPTPIRKGISGKDSLFLTGNNSLPSFA